MSKKGNAFVTFYVTVSYSQCVCLKKERLVNSLLGLHEKETNVVSNCFAFSILRTMFWQRLLIHIAQRPGQQLLVLMCLLLLLGALLVLGWQQALLEQQPVRNLFWPQRLQAMWQPSGELPIQPAQLSATATLTTILRLEQAKRFEDLLTLFGSERLAQSQAKAAFVNQMACANSQLGHMELPTPLQLNQAVSATLKTLEFRLPVSRSKGGVGYEWIQLQRRRGGFGYQLKSVSWQGYTETLLNCKASPIAKALGVPSKIET